MSKHKKHITSGPKEPFTGASEKPFSVKPDFSEIENRLAGDDGKTPDNAKKEISGAWFLAVLGALLTLLCLYHWLRQ